MYRCMVLMVEQSSSRGAIVTGAGVGLGNAIARRLAADGLCLVVNDLPSKAAEIDQLVKAVEAIGGKAVACLGDVSVMDNVGALVDICVEKYGGLDVMVANAGTAFLKPILDCTYQDVQDIFNVNFRSAWNCYQAAARQMIKQGKGHPFASAYSASKFAIRGLTQSAAQEWGRNGITVNAYCPAKSLSAELGATIGQSAVDPDSWSNANAVGRIGEPNEVAEMVSWLASPNSGFITGQSILIDGGMLFD
ncbi:NAD(P)-binding protein [Fistulina hepatica ATCC 64428]|uniref:NAD(P)-binding protein n=1 Tax=Fistulina hepatica ATCC 64428 TaxID=1128425 RepID=A0A0D7AL30_9AGAR|nr:NAD(P)-binding protein [Fistulina hepatica ATCC 64428]